VALLSGCGGAGEPAVTDPAAVQVDADDRPTLKASIGALSDYDIDEAFRALYPRVTRCVERGAARLEALGGELTIVLRISTEGSPRSAHLATSTIGDRATERCILREALARSWPRAVGGDGRAEHVYGVDPAVPVAELSPARARLAAGPVRLAVARCTRPLGGRWQATLYVRPSGEVASAGVAPPDAAGEEHADCVAEQLLGLRLPPHRQPLVKLTVVVR
jgi:hypothetical protein